MRVLVSLLILVGLRNTLPCVKRYVMEPKVFLGYPKKGIACLLSPSKHEQYPSNNTIRNSVIRNHHVCNWDATAGRMQLCKVFYATTMDFCPLFGCVCNYGATMITFIPTFG